CHGQEHAAGRETHREATGPTDKLERGLFFPRCRLPQFQLAAEDLGGDSLAIRGESDSGNLSGKLKRLALAVTEAPEIVPLTATDIALVLSRPLPIQQVQHLWDVPAGEGPLALDHLPRVQVAARPELLLDHSVPFFGECLRVPLCVLRPPALLFLQLAFCFRLYSQGIRLLVQGRLLRLGIAPERDDKHGDTQYRRNADGEEGGRRRTAPGPLADALPRTTRPGEDGLATEPALKVLGQRLR